MLVIIKNVKQVLEIYGKTPHTEKHSDLRPAKKCKKFVKSLFTKKNLQKSEGPLQS